MGDEFVVILVDLDDLELLQLFVLLTILPDLPNIGWTIVMVSFGNDDGMDDNVSVSTS